MGIVLFDQVAVIAVNRTNQISQRRHDSLWQTPPKAGGPRRQLDRQIRKFAAGAGRLGYQQRLHHADGFSAVGEKSLSVRLDVRFYVHIDPELFTNIVCLYRSVKPKYVSTNVRFHDRQDFSPAPPPDMHNADGYLTAPCAAIRSCA